jgi:hypothetical protein
MNSVFASIEHWPLSVWSREDEYAYFLALIFHAWGMALLVGGGVVIALRATGAGSAFAAMSRFRGILPVMWVGVALAAPSGLVLLVAYPAKALTNPVFAIKFACLAGAALLTRRLLRQETGPSRIEASVCLFLWLGGVAAGKLLLHTYHVLMVS